MNFTARIWQNDKEGFWLAEIPALDLMVQAVHKEELDVTIKDAVELLVGVPSFSVTVSTFADGIVIEPNDLAPLRALLIKRAQAKYRDRITINSGVMTGKPVIAGTCLTVEYILGSLAQDMTVDELLAQHAKLTKEDVLACFGLAADIVGNPFSAPLIDEKK
jgi:uncharacterized protein (DUF433 family)